jgi:hypothetical protein
MKVSISDELEYTNFTPRQSVYDAFVKRYGDEQSAVNALEFRIQDYLRHIPRNRNNRRPRKKLCLPINKALKKRLDNYCEIMNYSYNDFIEKVMICTRKP